MLFPYEKVVGSVKRAQITVFIILGILILATVVFFVYMTTQEAKRELAVERPAIAQVPQDVEPVRDFITECIAQVGTAAIKRLGERGGYVDREFSYNLFDPTEGDAVAFTDDASLVVPYWYHMTSSNDCTSDCVFELSQPPLFREDGPESIESQLSEYVSAHMTECTDFTRFEEQGYDIQVRSAPQLLATVTDEDVFFSGTFDVRVQRGGAVTDLSEFYAPIDVNLLEAYDLASEIVQMQSNYQFLESGARELITLFSGTSEDRLPPLYDFRISLDSPQFWIKQQVQEDVERMLSSHMSLVRASGTRNNRMVVSPPDVHRPLYEVLYNRQFYIPLNGTYTDYAFQLVHLPWWGMYFDLNCNGQMCTADTTTVPLQFLFGWQEYSFAYDVSYPALVQLTDPDALNGQGFVFQYFIEGNMRNNAPLQDAELLTSTVRRTPSIACNPDQFTSGELTITVLDAMTKRSVDGAAVMYRCGQDQCLIGSTEEGMLTSRLPKCFDGLLMVSKNKYASSIGPLSSMSENNASLLVELTPRSTVTVSARKLLFTKNGKRAPWKAVQGLSLASMDAGEEVMVMLSRIKDSVFDEEFRTVVQLESPDPVEAQLVPGEYEIKIVAVKYPQERVRIMPDERCKEFGFPESIFLDDVCYTVPEEPIVFDRETPLMYGGANLNATITVEEGDHVEFRYVAVGLDKVPERVRIIEDLDELGKVDMYSLAMRDRLTPVVR